MECHIGVISGDGIGPEIVAEAKKVLDKAGEKYGHSFTYQDILMGGCSIDATGVPLTDEAIAAAKASDAVLMGSIGGNTQTSPWYKLAPELRPEAGLLKLRKSLNLFANLRPCKNLPAVKTRFENVDLVVVRENTEDLYAGVEEQIDNDTAHSIKIITRKASERICKFAFDYAVKNNRHEVCCVTKANIMKLSDGLFLESFRNVAQNYPQIKPREILVDNLCMQLVQDPTRFDVLVLPNLYGDIVSDLTAGLIGGLGVAQGANIGLDCAVFEPVHGSAPDIKGQNKANPTALLLSAVEMLKYIGEKKYADCIEKALFKTLSDGFCTSDLGGNLSTTEFTQKIIENL